MEKHRSRVELLAPAGNSEKLETAIHYGADAVYLGGKEFSLRNFSGNFTLDELQQAVDLARRHAVRVYVTCNIYPRSAELDALGEYLSRLKEIGPDALIVADPGIFSLARRILPEIPVHISTQASTTNRETVRFWKDAGAKRVNMARELSLAEIREIAASTDLEVEAFVHGAMCIAYSGRCLLSSFMENRDSNRGRCCQPCRFQYAVLEEKRPGQYYPLVEDERGAYIFNSRDLCMVAHLPEMIRSGITSLKIEGRMKSIHYVATAVNVYRQALDRFYDDPDGWQVDPVWLSELNRVSHRGYSTGFYLGDPEETVPDYTAPVYAPDAVFAGKVLADSRTGVVPVAVRNKLVPGDRIELLSPGKPLRTSTIRQLVDQEDHPIPAARPNTVVHLSIDTPCRSGDLIRKLRL